jgi:hypothetical protein
MRYLNIAIYSYNLDYFIIRIYKFIFFSSIYLKINVLGKGLFFDDGGIIHSTVLKV